jgi:hypothetical protein
MSAPLPSLSTVIALHSHTLPRATVLLVDSYRPARISGLRLQAQRLWLWLMTPIEHDTAPQH